LKTLSITLPAGCGWRTESYGYDTRLLIPIPDEQTREELSHVFFTLFCNLVRDVERDAGQAGFRSDETPGDAIACHAEGPKAGFPFPADGATDSPHSSRSRGSS